MVTPEELAHALEYRDGKVFWKIKPCKNIKAGSEAGRLKYNGYREIRYKGKLYLTHRIVWCLCKGEWPPSDKVIDHINRNRSDNRIQNLRVVSQTENMQNQNVKGFFKNKKRYGSQIQIDGVRKHLGTFDTKEEAAAAYRAAKKKYHGICIPDYEPEN